MKTNNYSRKFILSGILLGSFFANAQTQSERLAITKNYDKQEITKLSNDFLAKEKRQKTAALEYARINNIPTFVTLEDGGIAELQRIETDGSLIYYRTFNVAAAKSTRTNHINSGGSLGLNLDGQNMTAYVWDGGHARVTHREYDGTGGTNRVTIEDTATEGGTKLNFHAAHVTGTIAASGFQANAKGMAWQAKVRGYMWNNDLSEATTAAASGMLISNHSYGYRSDSVPDYFFGAYIDDSRDWDNVHYNAPFYLMVVAAGNDGSTNYNSLPLNPSFTSFDKLTGHAVAKNNLVVANANDANIDTSGNLVSVTMNTSSSQGPTDDLRIKPDITGNGTGVTSSYESSDSAYGTITGTSMASPNVAGTLLLLQQHHNNLKGGFMRSATLKGLAMHTADDAGATGPDANFGWGLLNAKRAAETLTNSGNQSLVSELNLAPGQTYTINVNSDGVSKLLASISWTDPAGTATTTANENTARLVNDLDIRISKAGTTFLPWRLTGVNTNGLGDNTKDPYERVDVSGASGTYTITVTHKGTSLSGGSQNYSLIVTGLTGTPVACNATVPTGVSNSSVGTTSATVSWSAVTGTTYDVRYKAVSATTWTTLAAATNTVSLSGLTANTAYEAQVRSICPTTSSAFSASTTFTTTTIIVTYCASKGNNTNDERIQRVALGTINNASTGTAGYEDFTAQSTNVVRGTANTISITPFWTSTKYNEAYAVWIDYNKDGDFVDAGELVYSRAASQITPVSGTFTIPTTATLGSTRIRVSMKYNGIPTSCEAFSYGQVEDYTVNITSTAAAALATTSAVEDATLNIYPNPVEDLLNVSFAQSSSSSFRILNLVGQEVKKGNITQDAINVSNLENGMYIFEVNNGDQTITKKFVKK
jgi:trimeric autotransporter adhesin